MRTHRLAAMAVSLAAAFNGCASTPRPVQLCPHDHEAQTELPGGLPSNGEGTPENNLLVVDRAPPPPLSEIPCYQDQPPGHVWIPGYWRWDDELKDHVWVPGGWMRPPRERAWITPRWVEVGGGRSRFLPGYWR